MKKNIFTFAAAAVIAAATLSSCATISTDVALAGKAPVGQKVGEANSSVILGLWSSKGETNNLKEAAKNGGITNITQVEYINKSILGGIVLKRTTRVYGE